MLEQLKKIGLSENEAKVYTALLDLGNATVQDISRKAAIPRPTVYVQLEDLMKIGLASTFEKEPTRKGGATKTMFRAESPEHLSRFVAQQKAAISEKENLLAHILPDLGKYFASSGEHPKVRFFEGIEGLKTMQDEFLKTKSKLIEGVASLDDVIKMFPSHPDEYAPRRVQKGIHAKLIYTTSRGPILKELDTKMLRTSRYVPPEKLPFTSDITIYDNKVAISALHDKPLGVIIEDKEISDSLRALFYLAWEGAKKYN